MKGDKITVDSGFQKAAVYNIVVRGEISVNWLNWFKRLGGMQIEMQRPSGEAPVNTLVGQINEQSALSGILSTLYDLPFTIISLNVLKSQWLLFRTNGQIQKK